MRYNAIPKLGSDSENLFKKKGNVDNYYLFRLYFSTRISKAKENHSTLCLYFWNKFFILVNTKKTEMRLSHFNLKINPNIESRRNYISYRHANTYVQTLPYSLHKSSNIEFQRNEKNIYLCSKLCYLMSENRKTVFSLV